MNFSIKNLQIIIVLFKEKISTSISYKSITESDPEINVFIYDNSPTRDPDAEKFPNVVYIHDKRNLGVSTAYNEGAKFAKSKNIEWLLLLDQDTQVPVNFLSQLKLNINMTNPLNLYAMRLYSNGMLLSPCGYKFKRGNFLRNIKEGKNNLKKITFLNSGLLLSTELFFKVQGYDKNVPLYFSDFVFINRLRKHIKTFTLLPIDLIHNLSSNDTKDKKKFQGRYNLYLKGAFEALASEKEGYISYFATTFFRAIKLSLTLKDSYYIKSFMAQVRLYNKRRK
ncbi:MAG: glycosyltransferase [Sphingobacteriales bacterium]|nr:glycosyltransferase [Sphingobacteriales bacterium]